VRSYTFFSHSFFPVRSTSLNWGPSYKTCLKPNRRAALRSPALRPEARGPLPDAMELCWCVYRESAANSSFQSGSNLVCAFPDNAATHQTQNPVLLLSH
jgi:hypothetical protein